MSSLPSVYSRIKAEGESRLTEEKRAQERRKSAVVLATRFLLDQGYVESAREIQRETGVDLDKVDAADNMDLMHVMQEYEEWYQLRFDKAPRFTRKSGTQAATARPCPSSASHLNHNAGGVLPRLAQTDMPSHPMPPPPPRRYSSPGTNPQPALSPKTKQIAARRARERKGSSKSGVADAASSSAPDEDDDLPSVTQNLGAGSGDGPLLQLTGQAVRKNKGAGGQVSSSAGAPDAGSEYYSSQLLRPCPPVAAFDTERQELTQIITRDICTSNPGVPWDDIIGLDRAKSLLKEAIVMPHKYPQFFTGLLAPWRGILLFGPPGTGKTLLAKAVATECRTTFFNISASSIVSKWRGDSEKLVRVLFELARHHQPSTIFIDEMDAIMSQRGAADTEHEGSRRMKTELLIQMDGLLGSQHDGGVFLLAASNLPWDLDAAMLRRFEKRILVDLPDPAARTSLFRHFLPPGAAEPLDFSDFARRTEGFSGSDIRLLCKEAAMRPLRRLLQRLESSPTADCAPQEGETGGEGCREGIPQPHESGAADCACGVGLEAVSAADISAALASTRPASHIPFVKYQQWHEKHGSQ
ncbi:unnamed protein product [Vitrella brassicaformis CCMP3155]|uniref:Katanin p60 ATPase-containing subunit A-like 2 n=1 Tax=Vitrella brassicaformis (strain CCMP3155) TaxID=1169540 RepID=A0A0G4GQU7_VITBC|nr:unnamed protein product [Vitrella brassicaformis CCMP3155]|eukprot:CEM32841.1 unnamed protein product [Vitrella brassicaformis CCMP3155]